MRHWRQIPKDELQRIVNEHDKREQEKEKKPNRLTMTAKEAREWGKANAKS